MGEGLRPYYHQYYLYDIKKYYDRNRGCNVKKATFFCAICGHEFYEIYEYRPPPNDGHINKKLEKHKKKYNNTK